MRRLAVSAPLALLLSAWLAPLALAQEEAGSGRDYGEGWWGATNDLVVTKFGFALIAFFPLFIFTMSMLQWRLDKRKERRKLAAQARAAAADVRGGF